MQIKVNKKIGDCTVQFEVDEKSFDDSMKMLAFLTERDFCPL